MLWLLLLAAVARGEVLDLHTRFEKGQKFALEVKKQLADSKNKSVKGTSVTLVQVTVIEASGDGFVLDWVAGESVLSDLPPGNPAVLQVAAKAMAGVHVEFELGPRGEMIRLRNRVAVLPAVEKKVSELVQQIAAGMKAADKKEFLEIAARALTPLAVASGPFREAQIFCLLAGLSVDVEKPLKSKFVTSHPLGTGLRISSDVEMRVSRMDPVGKVAVVHLKQEYDRNGFVGMVRRVLAESGVGLTSGERMPEIVMTDESETAVDLDWGWPRTVKHTRRVEVGEKMNRADTTEISVKRVE